MSNNPIVPILKFYAGKKLTTGKSSESISLEGISYTNTSFPRLFDSSYQGLKKSVGRTIVANAEQWVIDTFGVSEDKDVSRQMGIYVFTRLRDSLLKKQREKEIDDLAKRGLEEVDYTNLIPIIDYRTREKLMYDMEKKIVMHGASYEAYEEWEKKQPADDKKDLFGRFTPLQIDFDPTKSGGSKTVTLENDNKITSVNSHNAPEWMKKTVNDPKMPRIFKELLEHLFPNEKCRKYVMFWAYNMLSTRCPTHLLLHGHHGIGKNTLVEIFANLVGDSNYYLVPKSFWGNNFNSELRHKRLLYFDEHSVLAGRRGNLDEFKQYYGPKMAYHGKFMSIQGIEKNHSSSIISNNLEATNHLVWESRRFSVPILTEKTILSAMGEEKLRELYSVIENPEQNLDFYTNLGNWILKYGNSADFKREEAYKSAMFYEIIEKALMDWQRYIINTITSYGEEIEISNNESLKYDAKAQGPAKCKNFLEVHKDEEGEVYGYVHRKSDGSYIVPSEKYARKEDKEDSIDYTKLEY